ncbi:hypothetical protein BH09BAC6_BH09BAC6_22030 [soil metagenome]|jgi:nucleotide-binding universal stress UspA family protein
MKTILVLTDFSENATCAAKAGLNLCEKLHTDLILFNTYINYATMGAYGGGGWIVDEFTGRKKNSKQGLELLSKDLEILNNELEAGGYKPVISFDLNDCDLQMDVADILSQNDIELIVMGARSHPKDEALYGADTTSIVNHANCPVLIIPAKTDLKQLQKMIFATDFDEAEWKAIHYLVKLGKLFRYQLEIVHVIKPDQKANGQNGKAAAFKEQLAQLNYPGLTCKELEGSDVINTLNDVCSATGPNLLALMHHQRSFFARLFAHSETKKALAEQHVPMMVFPEKMK